MSIPVHWAHGRRVSIVSEMQPSTGPPSTQTELQEESKAEEQREPHAELPKRPISKRRMYLIVATVAFITFVNSTLSGLMTVSLPTIARDIDLPDSLLLWPPAVSSLSCGCTLLAFGSISDVVGGRRIYLLGMFLLTGTTIACGLSRNAVDLILFRTAQGLAMALCLPSSVLLITSNIPHGEHHNIAFACLGAGQPVGFGFGLIIGGIFIEERTWRYGYYLAGGLTFAIFLSAIFALPADPAESQPISTILTRIRREIDWIGCLLLSVCNGIFLYLFSVLASDTHNFVTPTYLSLTVVAILIIPAFVLWVRKQERLGQKAIIPPSLWGNKVFATLCFIVFIVWGCFNATQYFISLYFQLIQGLSAIQTSLRFLPQAVIGLGISLLTGWLVKYVPAAILVLCSAIITAVCPILMTTIDPTWSYWRSSFFALICIPICADVLFTVANLLIISLFPDDHGLAGGVFNTVSNIGNSVGLAVAAVIAASVTKAESGGNHPKGPIDALMSGYRASFLACVVSNVFVLIGVYYGLRNVGKVGVKN
ncbi:putative MFS-type transporter [Lachnellula subtilissima]|uniref:Putative MFS-type transporter n=1 Tax=Lachnellula subtilissima TaxID=602034 RepID=A0A8H8RML5_9HELO|nr:putative MFS-type transporter [Lachnellula subtilissima]